MLIADVFHHFRKRYASLSSAVSLDGACSRRISGPDLQGDVAPRARNGHTVAEMAENGSEEDRDRYRELLEETRTVLPGVQVLFAFLLTAPFSQRFNEMDDFGRDLYTLALIGAALAMFLFLAPASYHRVAPRSRRRDRVRTAILLMRVAMPLLAIAVLLAVFAVLRFIFDATIAVSAVGFLGAAVVFVWYVVPLAKHMRDRG